MSRSARPTQLVQHGGRLLGRGEREDLDLVELVGAQHAAGVAPGRARLAAVARRVRHHPHRQLSVVEHLAGVDRGERHLGGGDAPQVVALDRVGVVGELGQLAGGGQRRGGDQRRRADLLERVGVAVERVLAQRPGQRGAEAALHGEHRAADLRGPLVVEDAERGGGLPVRHPLVVGERVGQAIGPVTTGLSASPAPSGASGCGRLGMRSSSSRSSAWTASDSAASARSCRRARGCAPAAARPRRRRPPCAARRPASTARSPRRAARRAWPRCRGPVRRATAAGRAARAARGRLAGPGRPHEIGIVAQQADVDHRNARLLRPPRGRWGHLLKS